MTEEIIILTQIIFIDLVLAGDNAIIIGMVASKFDKDKRKEDKNRIVTPMLNNESMQKQLTLIETENAGWQLSDTDKEAAKRGLAASRKALQEGRKRLADLLNAA